MHITLLKCIVSTSLSCRFRNRFRLRRVTIISYSVVANGKYNMSRKLALHSYLPLQPIANAPFSTAALATVIVVHFKMAALKDAWLIISQSDWHEGVLQLWYWPFCVGLLCAALLGLLLLLHLCKDKSKLFKQHALGTFLYGWERVVPTKTPRTEDWAQVSGGSECARACQFSPTFFSSPSFLSSSTRARLAPFLWLATFLRPPSPSSSESENSSSHAILLSEARTASKGAIFHKVKRFSATEKKRFYLLCLKYVSSIWVSHLVGMKIALF